MIWNKTQVLDYISKLKDDDIIEVTKKQTKSIRSLAQNKYFFGVVLKYICEHIWIWHKFEIMEQYKQIKDYFWLETTTDLSTSEFQYMCEEIRAWYLQERGLYIPLPRESEDLANLDAYLF